MHVPAMASTNTKQLKFTIPGWVTTPEHMLESRIMRLRSRINALTQRREDFKLAGLHPDVVVTDPRVQELRVQWKVDTPHMVDLVERGYPEDERTGVEDAVRCIREDIAIGIPKVDRQNSLKIPM